MRRRNFLKTHHAKLYQSQRYSNPHFRKTGLGIKARMLIAGLVGIAGLLALPFALGYAPVFKISETSISGLTSIPEGDVRAYVNAQFEKKVLGLFPQTSKFYFKKAQLSQSLNQVFDFQELNIDIKNSVLQIQVKERISEVVWMSGSKWYLLDLNGVIMRELSEAEYVAVSERIGLPRATVTEDAPSAILQPTMPLIKDESQMTISEGQQIMTPEMVQHILTFDEGVRMAGVQPTTYSSEGTTKWLRVNTISPFAILFETELDPEGQIEVLNTILVEYNDRLGELQYIDVRFGNHVFVK